MQMDDMKFKKTLFVLYGCRNKFDRHNDEFMSNMCQEVINYMEDSLPHKMTIAEAEEAHQKLKHDNIQLD